MGRLKLRRLIPFTCLLALALSALGCGGTAGRTDTPAALGGASNAAAPESLDVPDPADTAIPGAVEIAALPAPDGVEAGVWAELTAELRRVLVEYQPESKAISAPPEGDAGLVELSYYEPTSTLRWLYVSLGDYDQNGIVGVSDLTPLGVHFGEESPDGAGQPFPPESLGAAIDGNGDGLIGVSDIAPIGQNFGRRVEGYRVYVGTEDSAPPAQPDDPNGPGTALVGEVLLSAGDSTSGRLRFYRQVVPTQSEQYYWVRPYHGEEDGAASNSVHVLLPPPQPPVAALTPTGDTATLAHIVWDAGASHDPDGQIVSYEWDFDGDGVYEYDSDGADSVDFYYYAEGEYGCTVRVTDGDLMTDTATASVQVTESATWHDNVAYVKPVPEGQPGEYPILTNPYLLDVSGQPALVYTQRLDEFDAEADSWTRGAYVRALDQRGENWPEPQLVPGTNGGRLALVVDGRPAFISTIGKRLDPPQNWPLESSLLYLRAGNAEGSSWPIRETLGSYTTDDSGVVVSGMDFGIPYWLLLVDSAPAVLGYSRDATHYLYTRALDGTGSSWPAEITGGERITGNKNAINVLEDRLAAVDRVNAEDLLYYRNAEADELSWDEPVLVDKLERVDTTYALLDADGYPAVVYYDELLSGIKYRRASDSSGSSWLDLVVISVAADDAFSTGLIDGRPAVMLVDRIDDKVKLVVANNPKGTLWGFPYEVTTYPHVVGSSISPTDYPLPLASVSGLPAFAYSANFASVGENRETQLHYVAYY